MMLKKTRALRKYEGDYTMIALDAAEPSVSFFAPFGPLIAKSRLDLAVIDRLNAFADEPAARVHGSEFLVPVELARAGGEASLLRQLEALITRYIAQTERAKVLELKIDVIWIVSQFAGTPSPMHFHTGDVSGVLYLKTPHLADEDAEREKTYISGRQAGDLNFLFGGKQRLSRTVTSIRPEVGDIYIFPGWLLHGSEPFRGEGERRSLSFNAFVRTED
jgi:Putative 2OG-Fe(II) oxygenase